MQVRNKTLPKTEYLGRPCDASDAACPCRPCYSPHDYGWYDNRGIKHPDMRCNTRERVGCPMPKPEPEHVGRVHCKRCGSTVGRPNRQETARRQRDARNKIEHSGAMGVAD